MYIEKLLSHKILQVALATIACLLLLVVLSPTKANAAYEAGRLIDDSVLLDARSMDIGQIQSFLNGRGGQIAGKWFVMDCDAAGQQSKQVYISIGAPCGQTVPAANVIYYVAQAYGVNPKVILATMQKEQSLITAVNPTGRQYSQAMGYACPTSGNCNDSSNFFWQVDNGTWVLRYHFERARGNNNWWRTSTSWTCGTEKNLYKPNLYPRQNVNFFDTNGTHYATVYIQNPATSSFYCYTPHAYNNPSGLYGRAPYGTTGLYYSGSYNFVLFFEQWFGTTRGGHQIDMIKANQDITTTYNSYKDQLGVSTSEQVFEYSTDGRVWQNFSNGTIIWTQNYGAHPVFFGSIYDRWKILGGSLGSLGVPIRHPVAEQDNSRVWQDFRSGSMISSQDTGAWEIMPGPIGDKWRSLGGSNGPLGRPISEVTVTNDMRQQKFERGVVARKDLSSPAYFIQGNIYSLWTSNQSVLKRPSIDAVQENDGRIWQNFYGGTVIESDGSALMIRYGTLYNAWRNLGGSLGTLGKPTTNTVTEADGRIWQNFEHGSLIQKNTSSPAYEVLFGKIYDRWKNTGGSTGTLGTPSSSAITESDGRIWQNFEHGTIIWSQETGAWDITGDFYTFWKQKGGSLGTLGKPTGGIITEGQSKRQNFERGKIVWSEGAGWAIVQP